MLRHGLCCDGRAEDHCAEVEEPVGQRQGAEAEEDLDGHQRVGYHEASDG